MPSVGGSLDRLIAQNSWRLLRQPLFLVPVRARDRIDLSYKNLCLGVKDNMEQVFAEYKNRENKRKKHKQQEKQREPITSAKKRLAKLGSSYYSKASTL